MASSYDQLLNSLATSQAMATSANLKRYDQAMKIYDTIIENYSPGGAFEKATLSQLGKQKTRDVGEESQQLISSGLYGTTTMGATGRRWEESVGAPARLRLEDIQMQRLSEAQLGKAGFIERREDVGPDYSMLANLAAMSGQSSGGYGGGNTYGNTLDSGFGAYGTLGGNTGGGVANTSPTSSGPIHGTSAKTYGGPGAEIGKSMWGTYGSQVPGSYTPSTSTPVSSNTPTSSIPTSNSITKPAFVNTTNYLSMYYNKTGKQLRSQQEAYNALYS